MNYRQIISTTLQKFYKYSLKKVVSPYEHAKFILSLLKYDNIIDNELILFLNNCMGKVLKDIMNGSNDYYFDSPLYNTNNYPFDTTKPISNNNFSQESINKIDRFIEYQEYIYNMHLYQEFNIYIMH